ncbi:MAG: hypothetical protein IKQ48_05820 [Paludibacteraceae bacterium]|nr:hypothetical protein [Paludibacteraceae bacterium]
MRKLFIFSAVLMTALSLNATVLTKDITWTLTGEGNTFNLDGWGNMSTKWGWTEGCAGYDQLVFEFDNPTGDIVVKAQFTNGSGDIASTAVLHVGDNSLAVNVMADVLHSVDVKNFCGSAQTIKLNRMYLRKAVGPKQTETLWSGSVEFSDWKTWGDRLVIAPEKFAGLHVGDLIQLEYSVSGSDQKINLISPYNSYKMAFAGVLDEGNYNINSEANPSELTCAILSDADITNLQTQGGLSINALHITLTAVKLIKHEVLWTGSTSAGNWSGYQEINASKLADLKVGNFICVRLSDVTIDGESQVALWYNNGSWAEFSPSVNHVFQAGDETPMIVEFPVTYKMEKQLRGKNLLVRGKNFTMTDIYIEEGTPTTTVAEYLNVSAAGMATYVLPFDVPSLPDGIRAYNLTNDGSEEIVATETSALTADHPVLIIAPEGEYEFISEAGASDDISAKTGTYTNGALIGTYQTIDPLAQTTAGNYNYLLQNGTDGVAFYQVLDNPCSVAPYRAYLSCAYNAATPKAGMPPKKVLRIVFHENTVTGVEKVQGDNVEGKKLLRDGQLCIFHKGTIYNLQGQIIK